jgi:hypothetical protein
VFEVSQNKLAFAALNTTLSKWVLDLSPAQILSYRRCAKEAVEPRQKTFQSAREEAACKHHARDHPDHPHWAPQGQGEQRLCLWSCFVEGLHKEAA